MKRIVESLKVSYFKRFINYLKVLVGMQINDAFTLKGHIINVRRAPEPQDIKVI